MLVGAIVFMTHRSCNGDVCATEAARSPSRETLTRHAYHGRHDDDDDLHELGDRYGCSDDDDRDDGHAGGLKTDRGVSRRVGNFVIIY